MDKISCFSKSDKLYIEKSHITNKINVLKDKTIFITGSTGLIGRSLIEFLCIINIEYNYNIQIIAGSRDIIKASQIFNNFVQFGFLKIIEHNNETPIDIDDCVDFIIHCASNAHPESYVNQPIETLFTNILGIKNILDFSTKKKISKLVYISSSEVYGEFEDTTLRKETHYSGINPLTQRSNYPISKIVGENLCIQYIFLNGLDISIVRPGHVFGPQISSSDTRATAQFTKMAIFDETITMKSHGLQKRSYIYSFDCVTAILSVLVNGKNGEAYNISYPKMVTTVREIAYLFAEIVNKKLIYNEASELEMKGYTNKKDSSLDSDKLSKLGWIPVFDLNCAVKETIDIYRKVYGKKI